MKKIPPCGGIFYVCIFTPWVHGGGGCTNKKIVIGIVLCLSRFFAKIQPFFDKNSQFSLDNIGVRGYSMFAFRVNKERKKHRNLRILTDL